ncbi:MAG: biotin--[acetyl-CoA-carboxylase] ligase [Thermodesulfovibrionales bacterium]|nr:biotin--[acetyl-CoA-carboxylase] ligase [Thermodesulfovibrionales bacterium]
MNCETIKKKVRGEIGKKILFYQNTGSTNTLVLGLADSSAEGLVIIADSQNKGKGRLGRTWWSPPEKNIYMSILLKPHIEHSEVTLITLMSAVACTTAIRKTTGLNATIKWPNDLIVSDKKIGGILTELKLKDKRITHAVVGIGINVNSGRTQLPEDIRETATSIKIEKGSAVSRERLISATLNEIDRWYAILKNGGKHILLEEWQGLSSTLGKKVTVVIGNRTLFGAAESVDGEGRLILRLASGKVEKIHSGDLTVLR